MPALPTAGVPLNIPVAALKVTPLGSVPVSLNVGVGVPVAVTVKVPAVLTLNATLAALVIAGATVAGLIVSVKLCVAAGGTPLLAANAMR